MSEEPEFWIVMVLGSYRTRWERLGGSLIARDRCVRMVSQLPGVRSVLLGSGDERTDGEQDPHCWALAWERQLAGVKAPLKGWEGY